MDIRRFVVGRLSENTLIVSGAPGRCIVIDPGFETPEEGGRILEYMRAGGLVPEAILLTHGHMDHMYGVAQLVRLYGVPVYMSDADKPVVEYFQRVSKFGINVPELGYETTPVTDGQIIDAAGLHLRVITTPGHSPGSVCYLEESEKTLFTGDTLFAGSIGRTDLYLGDYDSLIRSIMEKLMALPGDTEIYPGHGAPSTIGQEMTTNPFLEPFNEREEIPELNEYI